ncbi:MAG: chromosome segregation protein SMC [Burkholderiaceae bacterium]|jgi:chromosome segregation protein|nr:chromosome segregation protein SMC [Burkholderiaceae bacterium]
MRLTAIRLSGFKSFVDPTSIQVRGQLVGIVGPNGCGKSNIMDAVRWVLGESRASELRGESMRDVIFNGTAQRNPSGRASVELAFDNAEGRAGGQWGKYGELAVRRVLTRDGNASYHVNSMTVRRRDVRDIFMGTGLGPRAYAIIGQGMIARIIEARPEELRVFLEEAAGVSRYRERRRETENRLHDTRENLVRVEDILREINQHVGRLEEQAAIAARYLSQQKEQAEKQELLWLLEKQKAEQEYILLGAQTREAKGALEKNSADVLRYDNLIESLRQSHASAGDELHAAQGALYQTNAGIGGVEAEIRHVMESRQRIQAQIDICIRQQEQWQQQEADSQEELVRARARQVALLDQGGVAREEVAQWLVELPDVEKAWRQAQEKRAEWHDKVMQIQQEIALSSANHQNATATLSGLAQRRERLLRERDRMDVPDEGQLARLRAEYAEKEEALDACHAALTVLQDSCPDKEENRRVWQEKVEQRLAGLVHMEARLSALLQLQESALSHTRLDQWLREYELSGLQMLLPQLQVEQGWEVALESLLGSRTQARNLSRLEWTEALASDPPKARISFYSMPPALLPEGKNSPEKTGWAPFVRLLRIQDELCAAVLHNWLHDVYAASSMKEALAQRRALPEGACFVLREGHIVDRHSVCFYAAESETEGVLVRQKEIEALQEAQQGEKSALEAEKACLSARESEVDLCHREMQQKHQQATALTRELHTLQLQVVRLSESRDHFLHRQDQIELLLAEIGAQEAEQGSLCASEEARMEALDASLSECQLWEEASRGDLEEREEKWQALQQCIREGERKAQEIAFQEEAQKKRMDELDRHIGTAREQVAQLSDDMGQSRLSLEELDDHVARDNLQVLLDQRVSQENRLTLLRQKLDEAGQALREAQEQRLLAERELQPQREKIVNLQLAEQSARIRMEQYIQKLEEGESDISALLTRLHPDMTAELLSAEIARLASVIVGLGAVNLAAAEELTESQQRRQFFEEQHADVTSAIHTLEEAIRQIDRESRALLQNTFDQVNGHLSELFPILFGGGQASLIMTGDEILDAGVQIMVHPPGKKNVTIHLLSGGEKALAAIALVFSLFQLNPAPFCLLDEVDAPLDDANTERFCNMVRRMSDKTQFLFVSHNKIAMEMAQQLIGVTMQEQGVSRIVAVDMEEAAELSQEGLTA